MYDEGPPVWTFLEPPPALPEQVVPEQVVPELPAELRDAPVLVREPEECSHCAEPPALPDPETDWCLATGASGHALRLFRAAWVGAQQARAALWQTVLAVQAESVAVYGEAARRHVSQELALIGGVHWRATEALLDTAAAVVGVPGLLGLVQRGQLSEQHVRALLEEADRWADSEQASAALIRLTLDRCQDRLEEGRGWPAPALLRKRLQTAALLMDLSAAERDEKTAGERRGVSLFGSGRGRGTVAIEGPAVTVSRLMDAIRARAEQLGRQPGDARTLEQRLFDAAYELLTVDADGGPSAVPTLDDTGQLVGISVRSAQVHVVLPLPDPARPDGHEGPGDGSDGGPDRHDGDGGDEGPGSGLGPVEPDPLPSSMGPPAQDVLGWQRVWGELPELIGFGPVTPALARDIIAAGARVRRAVVDRDSGALLAVDDPVPPPRRAARRAAARCCDPDEVLARLRAAPVVLRDLATEAYRPGSELRRFVVLRDRGCVFPGCAVTARFCDMDHVKQHHLGGRTSPCNTHCLCRRHHQAKQSGLFRVHRNTAGQTVWTTRDGHEHTAPARAG